VVAGEDGAPPVVTACREHLAVEGVVCQGRLA
jgi:hypothetical protein